MARPALALGGLVMIGVGVVMAAGWWWPSSTQANAEVQQQIRTVRIANDSGSVTIRAADVSTTTVRQRFDYRWNKPGDAYAIGGDQLVLGDCGWNCSVDYEVTVPRNVTVTGDADSGDITVDGAAGADVSADSGQVKVLRATGPVKVKASSGDIEVTLAVAQDVRAHADSGHIEVTVPNDRYRVQGESDSGDREIAVATDPAAPHLLDLSTDSGDVTVKAA